MNKLKQFGYKVKTRWNAAPTWVKVLDISCWVTLIAVTSTYLYSL